MQIKTERKWSCCIVVALAMVVLGLSCEKQENGTIRAQETAPEPVQSARQVQPQFQPSEASQRFSQALSDGKYVYLFFFELDNDKCQMMEKNLDSFAGKTKKNVEIIKVDRKDSRSSDIVRKLRTQTAPIPLTLLIHPGGTAVAGFTEVVSVDQLTQVFPSPKKDEVLNCIGQGKGVILCFSKKDMASREEVKTCCSQAETRLAGKAEYIDIDLSDPKEAGFIAELRIDASSPQPLTFVINPQGQVTGKYREEVQVADLVQAATKVVKSGCCPPSSGKTCAPTDAQKKASEAGKP
jgi:hypothetical protein